MREQTSKHMAYGLWLLLFVVVSVMLVWAHHPHTVVPNYRNAAIHWLHQNDLYNNLGAGFIYLPSCAVLFIPFAKLPGVIAEMLWRGLSLGLLAYGLNSWLSMVDNVNQIKHRFFWASLIALPLAYSSARNGQMNLVLAAFMMLALVALARGHFSKAAIYLCIGIAFKPTMIVALLLAGAIYRSLWMRLFFGVLLVLVLPFLTQNTSYVYSQYLSAANMLHIAAHVGMSQAVWAQIFSAASVFGFTLPALAQTGIRLVMALVFLIWMIHVKKQGEPRQVALMLYTLAATYLMLFNPRTENNDYIILAPSLAYFICYYWQVVKSKLHLIIMLIATFGMAFSYNLSKMLTPTTPTWVAPIMALAFLCLLAFSWRFEKGIQH